MQPIDLRNATFADVLELVTERRRAVLAGWRRHGRGTTRQLAQRMGLDVLNVRPRTTELVQLGLVQLVERAGTEGVYEALSDDEARTLFAERSQRARTGQCQPELKLTA